MKLPHNPGYIEYLRNVERMTYSGTLEIYDCNITSILKEYSPHELKSMSDDDISRTILEFCKRKAAKRGKEHEVRSSSQTCKSYRSALRRYVAYLNAGGIDNV